MVPVAINFSFPVRMELHMNLKFIMSCPEYCWHIVRVQTQETKTPAKIVKFSNVKVSHKRGETFFFFSLHILEDK